MKLLIAILTIVTVSLIFGTYTGNLGLEVGFKNMQRAYALGCGVGVVRGNNYTKPLDDNDSAFCTKASSYFID